MLNSNKKHSIYIYTYTHVSFLSKDIIYSRCLRCLVRQKFIAAGTKESTQIGGI